jgi:hypothetical protein
MIDKNWRYTMWNLGVLYAKKEWRWECGGVLQGDELEVKY